MRSFMSDYMTRMENNQSKLLEVSEKLKALGCKTYSVNYPELYGRKELIDYIVVEKEGKRAYVGFEEVPYRWYISSDGNSHTNTRGLTGKCGYDFPFTVEEILNVMGAAKGELPRFYVEL